MKKILSIIVPSLIIFIITYLSRADKNILIGLFLLFPVIFVIQGAMYSNLKEELLVGLILSSISFIIPINLFYNMGSCIGFMIIYNLLGIVSYCIKNKIIYRDK